jgi:hypothetical protein
MISCGLSSVSPMARTFVGWEGRLLVVGRRGKRYLQVGGVACLWVIVVVIVSSYLSQVVSISKP